MKRTHRVLQLESYRSPLVLRERRVPDPGPDQVRIRIEACGVCRTDLHVRDGELDEARLPIVLGHEIVGRVDAVGPVSERTMPDASQPADDTGPALRVGDRVGVPWLGWTCGACAFCRRDEENLCDRAVFTGYHRDGGYAEYTIAESAYCFPVPDTMDPTHAAPLLCAGLIGYRAYRLARHSLRGFDGAGEAPSLRLGLYGFGAAAHILAQVAIHDGHEVYAFTRPGDGAGQEFAKELGAAWAGDSTATPPSPLDAALLFAPVGSLVPTALRAIRKGGSVICAGIHMSEIPAFPYAILWEERTVRSVANLTRRDGTHFFEKIATIPVRTEVETFPLEQADEALERLRSGALRGAAVLVPGRTTD
ncbi:MAG: zinc-dependent alcohol dehydrogenase family protein [Candidatus Eisenbacteria bacterium]|uniref:Zinc-dependent alcohol dehydrogenase family protein n=1 Tax=Eiseniibacteriota bacterium TaxID=2212470 RepID=A0A956M0A9_UNCEI|nr:zinc-dependent alcohol dehydrogenase family protein [Candidatus Eisenbacteria bacterium]